MKRRLLFSLLASLLGGAASNAILFAAESQVGAAPVTAVAPTAQVTPTPTSAPQIVTEAQATEAQATEAQATEAQTTEPKLMEPEVDLLLIFPVQEPLKRPHAEAPDEAAIAAAAQAGKVWVNAKSKVFHRAGTTYYGKTKAGFFLPEAQAIEQGYRGVKE